MSASTVPRNTSVELNINNNNRIFKRYIKDVITDKGLVQFFEIPDFEKDWEIPLLYCYMVLNGRYMKAGNNTAAHVCPCVLKHKENYELQVSPGSYQDYEKKDCILLSIWRTRCVTPNVHLVLYFPGDTNCVLHKDRTPAFLQSRYCDLSAPFDEEGVKK